MENFNAKEYRDNLAKDLKEIRKTDPEKAQEVLAEAQETEEYQEAKRIHLENKSIKVKELKEIKECIGESFLSKPIIVSIDSVKNFVDVVGDINPIHFDEEKTKDSALEEMSGKIFVPGAFTQSLVTNKECIHKALTIDESHEIIFRKILETKFIKPIIAGSNLTYHFTINDAKERNIRGKESIEVIWKISTFSGEDKDPSMISLINILYISLDTKTH